jgi:hypothetical protein
LDRGLAGLEASRTGDGVALPDPRIAAAPTADGRKGKSLEKSESESRSVTVGDITFVVLDDGTIEAHGPEGMRRFGSMQELREHLKDRHLDPA